MNSILDAALFYALKMGWEVIPVHAPVRDENQEVIGCTCKYGSTCSRIGKHPITPHGVKDCSKDESVIRGWWEQFPGANIGIATGWKSSLLVLDVDEGGMDTLAERKIALPSTVVCLTGRGAHYYFCMPSGHLGNRENLLGSPQEKTGLDVRGDGGYVLAPPSLHRSGRLYTWECDQGAGEIPLAEIPSFVLNAYLDSSGNGKSKKEDDGESIIPPGLINTTLTAIAGKCRRLGCNEQEIFVVVKSNYERRAKAGDLEYSSRTGKKPFSEDDLWRISRSIAKKPAADALGLTIVPSPCVGHVVIGESSTTGTEQGLAAPLAPPSEPIEREDHLAILRQYLNLYVTRVVKRGTEHPQFELLVKVPPPPDPEGKERVVVLGDGLETLDPRKFRAKVWETLLIQIPARKADATWERITASMAAIAEVVFTTDTAQLLDEYVRSMIQICDHGTMTDCDLDIPETRKNAISILREGGWIMDKEGFVYFSVLGLRMAAKRYHQIIYSPRDLACRLSQSGYTPIRIRHAPEKYARLQIRCWKSAQSYLAGPEEIEI